MDGGDSKRGIRMVFFATDKEGALYVKLKAIMDPLVAMCDGLTIVYFGKGKTPYLKIDDAISWCRKEMKHHSADKYQLFIDVMEIAKAQEHLKQLATNSPQQ